MARLLRTIRNHQTVARKRQGTRPRRDPRESAPDSRKTAPTFNNLSVESLEFALPENSLQNDMVDKTSTPVYNALNEELPKHPIQCVKMEKLLPFFQLKDDILIYDKKMRVPSKMSPTYSILRTVTKLLGMSCLTGPSQD